MTAHGIEQRATSGDRDLGSRRWAVLVWAVCVVVVVAGVVLKPMRPWAWTGGFGVSGALCVANAVRSGRLHCVFTGPILLIGAVLTVARAMGWLTVGWRAIGGGVLVAVVVALAFEVVSGKKRIGSCC
jgi:hypothetical protein